MKSKSKKQKTIVELHRANKGRGPINRYDADITNRGAALNSVYINDGFLPKSDRIKIIIQEL